MSFNRERQPLHYLWKPIGECWLKDKYVSIFIYGNLCTLRHRTVSVHFCAHESKNITLRNPKMNYVWYAILPYCLLTVYRIHIQKNAQSMKYSICMLHTSKIVFVVLNGCLMLEIRSVTPIKLKQPLSLCACDVAALSLYAERDQNSTVILVWCASM